MKDTLLILARQGLAATGASFVYNGVTIDASSTSTLFTGVLLLVASVLWSWLSKLKWVHDIDADEIITDDRKAVLQKLGAAVASQCVAALAGWLLASGFQGDANDPLAVALFVSNVAASRLRGVPPVKVLLFALGSLPFALCSCSSTSQEALKSRLEAAFVSVAKEMSAVTLAATLQTLRSELALLEAKPVDTDPMQQLLDQNRIAAIKAAIRLGEERLAKLRGSKAVIEVNPVSSVISGEGFTTEGTEEHRGLKVSQTVNPLRGGRSGISQSMPYHARPVKVLQASASPPYAASRLAGQPQGRVTIPAFAPHVVAHLSASH